MDEIEQVVRQGQSATGILESETFKEAIRQVRQDALEMFTSSKILDKESRECSFFLMQAIDKLEMKLRIMMSNGKMEEEKIKRRGRPPRI